MILLFLLFAAPIFALEYPSASFETVKTYEQPDGTFTLTQPFGVTGDEQGNLYILDSAAKSVFIWDKDGQFVRNIGRPGEGPGELLLEDLWGSVVVTTKHILVADSKARKVHFWNRDYSFLKTVSIGNFGRIKEFRAHRDGYLLKVSDTNAGRVRLIYVDQNFEERHQVAVVNDARFKKNKTGHWHFKPYAEALISTSDLDEIWVANSNRNWVRQMDATGKVVKEFKLPLHREAPKEEDIAHYRKEFAKWASDKDEISFPEHAPAIDGLMVQENGIILACNYNMDEGLLKGLAVDRHSGLVKGRLALSLGSDLSFAESVFGMMVFVAPNDEGDYVVTLNQLRLDTN